MIIFTMYGGGFATIPAYLADVFGTRYVGAIHGRLLTAWSVAGILGPVAITWLRESALQRAVTDLAGRVDPARFAETFGAGIDQRLKIAAASRNVDGDARFRPYALLSISPLTRASSPDAASFCATTGIS